MGDAHVYENHIEPLQEQISRSEQPFPKIRVVEKEGESLEERRAWSVEKCLKVMEQMEVDRFDVQGYSPLGKIVMKMSA